MIDPLVRHSASWLRRAPGWALVTALASAALALATATAPLVTDAAADRAFAAEVDAASGSPPGQSLDARAATRGIVDPTAIETVGGLLDDLPNFGPSAASVSPLAPYVDSTGPLPVIRSASGEQAPAVVYARDGATESLGGGANWGSPGVWVPDTVADALDLRAGDRAEVTLARAGAGAAALVPAVAVRVAGVYPTRGNLPSTDGIDWAAIPGGVPRHPLSRDRPAPLLLADRATALSLIAAMGDTSLVTWDVPWQAPVDIAHGRTAAAGVAKADGDLHGSDSPIEAAVRFAGGDSIGLHSGVNSFVDRSEQAAGELQPLVASIALTGRVMSGLVLVVGAWLLTRSRRREHQLSISMGIHPARLAFTTGLELLVPLLVGVGAAYCVVRWQPWWLAGRGSIDTRVIHRSTSAVLTALAMAALLAVVAAFAEVWPLEPSSASRARRVAGIVPADTIVVVAALATGAQLVTLRGRAMDSGISLLFPLFAELAGAVVVVRLVGMVARLVARRRHRRRGRPRRRPRSLAVWFARRRAATSFGQLSALVVVLAAGVGLFVYSSSVADNGERSVSDKAAALGGAVASVPIASTQTLQIGTDGFPTGLPHGMSVVWSATNVHPAENLATDLLIVDSATFGDAVDWRRSFAQGSLAALLDALDHGNDPTTTDVAIAGNYNDDFPDTGILFIEGSMVRFRVVARIAAAPWIRERSSMMLVSARRLADALPVDPQVDPPLTAAETLDRRFTTSVWARAPRADVIAALGSGTVRPADLGPTVADDDTMDTGQAERTPQFVAFTMSLPYLRVVGIGLLVIALASIVVVGARRRVDLALEIAMTDRMGIKPRAISLAVVGGSLLLGLVSVAIGLLVTWPLQAFMIGRLDPAPSFAPGFSGGVSSSAVVTATLAVLAVSLVGSLIEVRSARRARVVEVLRGAE